MDPIPPAGEDAGEDAGHEDHPAAVPVGPIPPIPAAPPSNLIINNHGIVNIQF